MRDFELIFLDLPIINILTKMKKITFLCLMAFFTLQLSAQTEDKDIIIQALKNEVRELTKQNEELKVQLQNQKSLQTNSRQTAMTAEEYRIQLGVQSGKAVNLSPDKHKMNGSFINGKFVYDIGGFTNPDDAYQLSQDMRKLNLSGAFVTRYYNGVRDKSYSYTGEAHHTKQVNFVMPPTTNDEAPTKNETDYYDVLEINVPAAKKSPVLVIED